MTDRLRWPADGSGALVEMSYVPRTGGALPFFGAATHRHSIAIEDYFIGTVPVTEALWAHVVGDRVDGPTPRHSRKPVVDVSWDDIAGPGGFLERLNSDAEIVGAVCHQAPEISHCRFRLPSEAEWEYAARGGPRWPADLRFSGSDEIDQVGWYDGNADNMLHDVGTKAANQLGIFDMSGNVWEWCHDHFTRDVARIPRDGSPFIASDSPERVLRGGSYHNRAAHCAVSKRYEIDRAYADGRIGFRLALGL